MPLATGGIPIKIASLAVAVGTHSSLHMNVGHTHLQALPTSQNPLSISPVVQKESQWCWAACVEMVMEALQSPEAQCQVVNKFPGDKPPGQPCVDSKSFRELGCSISQMSDVWASVNVQATLVEPPGTERLPALEFSAVKEEIDAKRPIEVGLTWYGGRSGHAMIVKGYGQIDGRDSVWINDPLGAATQFGSKINGAEGQVLFEDLMAANGHGKWVCSWIELALAGGH